MKTKKVWLVLAVIVAAFCLAGCGGAKKRSVVSVSGVGTVMAQPDTVQMQISLNKTAATTRQAKEEVGVMVKQALEILEESGIENKNISTPSLRFYPEYDWGATRRVLVVQRVEQVISFSAGGIDTGGTEQVSNIIDRLIRIDGIELQQMNFSVKDTGELFFQSRELAWKKALEKAEQYAKLSGMKITGTLSIVEEGNLPVSPVFNRALVRTVAFSEETSATAGSTMLPTGEIEITSRIIVEFLLK